MSNLRPRDPLVGSIAVVAIILVLSQVLKTDNTDFVEFWTTAQALAAGQAAYPYFSGPDGQVVSNLNPPHFHLPLMLALHLGQTLAHLLWVFAGIFALWYSERLVGVLRRRPGPLALMALSSNAVILSVLGTDAPVWLLSPVLVFAWFAHRRGAARLSGLLLGFLISLKLFLLAFVPWLIWRREWRVLVWLALGFVLPFAIGLSMFGWAPYEQWLRSISEASQTAFGRLNMSLLGVLARAGFVSRLWQAIIIAPVVALAGWCLRRATIDEGWTVILLAALLCSPVGWIYYASWLWPVWLRWRGSWLDWTAVSFWLVPPQLVTSHSWLWGSPYAWGLVLLFASNVVRILTTSDADHSRIPQ